MHWVHAQAARHTHPLFQSDQGCTRTGHIPLRTSSVQRWRTPGGQRPSDHVVAAESQTTNIADRVRPCAALGQLTVHLLPRERCTRLSIKGHQVLVAHGKTSSGGLHTTWCKQKSRRATLHPPSALHPHASGLRTQRRHLTRTMYGAVATAAPSRQVQAATARAERMVAVSGWSRLVEWVFPVASLPSAHSQFADTPPQAARGCKGPADSQGGSVPYAWRPACQSAAGAW